ncbi:hypothetical protein HMPREF1582_01246, partial [Gardnerella vaginalis JCP8151A]
GDAGADADDNDNSAVTSAVTDAEPSSVEPSSVADVASVLDVASVAESVAEQIKPVIAGQVVLPVVRDEFESPVEPRNLFDDAANNDSVNNDVSSNDDASNDAATNDVVANDVVTNDDASDAINPSDVSDANNISDVSATIASDSAQFTPAFEPGSVFEKVSNGEFSARKEVVSAGGFTSEEAQKTDDFAEQFEMAKYQELLPFLAMNTNLYDDLYAWLSAQGNADVDQALAQNSGYSAYRNAIGL